MGHGCHDCGCPNMCICDYESDNKTLNEKFVGSIAKLADEKTAAIGASLCGFINDHTVSGRTDSSKPNLSNAPRSELEEIAKLDSTGYLKWTGRGTYEAYKPAPISLELEDGDCTVRINGQPVGFCRRAELKIEVGRPTELTIERLAHHNQKGFMEDVEAVREHVGHLRLILDYYKSDEDSSDYFKKE